MDVGVQVFIKMPTGQTIQIESDPTNHSCLDLKKKITALLVANKEQSCALNQQILSFSGLSLFRPSSCSHPSGTRLDESRKLSDYNIRQDSTICLSFNTPPEDILDFDKCQSCQYKAIDPVVLPCGHSCCRYCVPVDAVACPIVECKSSLNGIPREVAIELDSKPIF